MILKRRHHAAVVAAEIGTEDAVVVAITELTMKSNAQKLSLPLKHREKLLLMKRSLQTDVEVAEAVAVVVVKVVRLRTDVTNVPKVGHVRSEKIGTNAHSVKIDQIEHNAKNARKITKILSRLFVKKTKKLNSSYLNLSTTSSEQWVL
jgi:hypothetical protein